MKLAVRSLLALFLLSVAGTGIQSQQFSLRPGAGCLKSSLEGPGEFDAALSGRAWDSNSLTCPGKGDDCSGVVL